MGSNRGTVSITVGSHTATWTPVDTVVTDPTRRFVMTHEMEWVNVPTGSPYWMFLAGGIEHVLELMEAEAAEKLWPQLKAMVEHRSANKLKPDPVERSPPQWRTG